MMQKIEVPIAKRMLEIYASAVDGKINVTTEIIEAANTLYAQQAKIERLKGEYARGIEDAAQWHIKQGQYHLNSMNCGSENGDGKRVDAINAKHVGYAKAIRALLPKQKEGE